MNGFYSPQAGATVRWLDLPGYGEPIVFIHGLGCASSYDYPRVAADPALAGRRMILVDLPGFGYSDKPESFSYRIADQAAVVVELVDRLALERCYLFGHSMGGSVAIEAAGRLAGRVRALLVAEPNLYPGGECTAGASPGKRKNALLPAATPKCSPPKPRPGPAACKTAPPGRCGAARPAW